MWFYHNMYNLTKQAYVPLDNVRRQERTSNDWKKSSICPIYKKDDKLVGKNHRGISLSSVQRKVLTYIITNCTELPSFSEKLIQEYQKAFTWGNPRSIKYSSSIRRFITNLSGFFRRKECLGVPEDHGNSTGKPR